MTSLPNHLLHKYGVGTLSTTPNRGFSGKPMDFGGPNLGTLPHEGTPSNFYIWAPHTAMGCFFLRNLWHLLECTHNPKNGDTRDFYGCKSDPYGYPLSGILIQGFLGGHPRFDQTSHILLRLFDIRDRCGCCLWLKVMTQWMMSIQLVHLQSC